jgi:3-oxoacyl-[acyl-carrier protein] reductase
VNESLRDTNPDTPDPAGRRVVVSGGGTGLGLAVTRRFVGAGDRVVILGRREQVLVSAAAELNRSLVDDLVTYEVVDLENPVEVTTLARRLATGAPVDVLVNNAGGLMPEGSSDLADVAEHWLATYRNNVVTTVLLSEAVLPLVRRPGGRVVAMSSLAALSGAGAYGSAKAALHAWVYTQAAALGGDGITVNAVAPGFVPDTGFWEGRRSPEIAGPRIARTLVGRAGTPAEVAEAVFYLASREAGFTTGQVLQVNGGAGLGRG